MVIKDEELGKLYMKYEGPFIIQIIFTFAKFLLENTVVTKRVSKKLFRVFIELAQNVSLYSVEREEFINGSYIGKGKVYIMEYDHFFKCITINKIQKEHVEKLITNCTIINASTMEALRTKKKELYKIAKFQDTSAHIGLIMLHVYSTNPIEFEFIEENGDTYFKIAVVINKINA